MKALAVATGIVFWTLVLGVAWLAFFPGSETGEPVAILQIEPATAPDASESTAPATAPVPQDVPGAASQDGMALPPGFAVGPSGGAQAPIVEPPVPTPGTTLQPMGPGGPPALPAEPPDDAMPPEGIDPQGAAPSESGMQQQAALETPATATPPPPPPPIPESETGTIPLPPVPVAELVEESQYGPLPKVALDGRRSIEVYARPSRYALVGRAGGPPRVALLVTGLGLPDGPNSDVLDGLPAQVSVAYGAYGRSLQDGVAKVRADGHEVLLQIPLEPENYPTQDPGPHTLLTTLPPEENLKRLQWLMSRYTGYVGVTNHMGAKFEAVAESMQPVMEELKRRGLLYVDDGSVTSPVSERVATAIGLDYSEAKVQINAQSAAEIAKQLAALEEAAAEQGAAIGVAPATPATVKQITEWAGKLEAKGIVLVPVSTAVRTLRQS
ncbi:MAG TPA: divergent polysaccharide deacetylase family protein [Methyloceanibacter sp.]|nr:divergent polysaccharide deacetylase family protein [Methyloceanibacter sp.]